MNEVDLRQKALRDFKKSTLVQENSAHRISLSFLGSQLMLILSCSDQKGVKLNQLGLTSPAASQNKQSLEQLQGPEQRRPISVSVISDRVSGTNSSPTAASTSLAPVVAKSTGNSSKKVVPSRLPALALSLSPDSRKSWVSRFRNKDCLSTSGNSRPIKRGKATGAATMLRFSKYWRAWVQRMS